MEDLAVISESEVYMIANIYNDFANKLCPHDALYMGKDFSKQSWYNDIIKLIRIMDQVKAKPRLYIQAQFAEYKKPVRKGRNFPTIGMMCTPAGVERYESFMTKNKRVESHILSSDEVNDFSINQMRSIMERLHIATEEDFFKDPYLISQLAKTYVKHHPAFQKLVSERFYQTRYKLDPESLVQ